MCALCLCLCIGYLAWSTLQQQRFTSHLRGAIKSDRVALSCSGILLDNSNQNSKGVSHAWYWDFVCLWLLVRGGNIMRPNGKFLFKLCMYILTYKYYRHFSQIVDSMIPYEFFRCPSYILPPFLPVFFKIQQSLYSRLLYLVPLKPM